MKSSACRFLALAVLLIGLTTAAPVEEEKSGKARLSLYVKLSEPNVHLWDPPVGVESKFYQEVRLVRDSGKHTEAVTWESYDTGEFVKTDSGNLTLTDQVILDVVNRQIDEFIKVFKAANNLP